MRTKFMIRWVEKKCFFKIFDHKGAIENVLGRWKLQWCSRQTILLKKLELSGIEDIN